MLSGAGAMFVFQLSRTMPGLLHPSIISVKSEGIILAPLQQSETASSFGFELNEGLVMTTPSTVEQFSLFLLFF